MNVYKLLLSFFLVSLVACTNDTTSLIDSETSELVSKFNLNKDLGYEHRNVLEFSYNRLLNQDSETRTINCLSTKKNLNFISSILEEYNLKYNKATDDINSEKLNEIIDIASIISNDTPLESRTSINKEYEIPEFVQYFFSLLNNDSDRLNITDYVKECLRDTERKFLLSDFEKDCLVSSAIIFEDSYNYWVENFDKWQQLNNTQTRGWWSDRWDDLKRAGTILGTADAAGAAAVYVQAGVAAVSSGGTLALPAGAAVAGAAGASSVVAGVASFF